MTRTTNIYNMSVGDWHNDGDLSHDFTACDCENLVAMLDVASSSA